MIADSHRSLPNSFASAFPNLTDLSVTGSNYSNGPNGPPKGLRIAEVISYCKLESLTFEDEYRLTTKGLKGTPVATADKTM